VPDARPFVLNVNDDEANRYMVTRILEQAGYTVAEAVDGREALLLARRKPQIVILDVKLPDISGLEVCRRLKADPELRKIPVLQTSATFISAERRVEGLDSGADAYLAQPIEPPELVATVRSLLRTQRVEAELKAASEDWRLTFDAIADGLAILSPDGTVIRCNHAMSRIAGKPCDALVGVTAPRLLPQDGATTADVIARAVRNRSRTVGEASFGTQLLRVVADPILDRDGGVERLVLIVTDITEHRQLEDDHRARAAQLSDLDRRKDEFLGMLAHELRNPLNAIAAANSLMDRVGAQDARNERLRNTVRRQTRHLARLVDDLLEVSRVTRGKMRLQQEPNDLVTVLQAAVENSRPSLEARQQQLDLSVPTETLPINADALRLEQVFVNLLANASKYSEPGARVVVECRRIAPDRAAISVKDEGIGIPKEKLESVFDLFFQVDQSLARSLGGLGIGLTIARRLVELHGGTIRAQSDGPGRGSELIVELPLAAVALASDAGEPSADALDADVGEPLNVLLVEDNRDARETLRAWLEEIGHHVTSASDGFEGLQAAREIKPDVALIDIGLPGIDGYQVARNMRESEECRDTFLVAITGYGRPEDSARAREAGFDVHLVKPVQPERLARVIRAARCRPEPSRAVP
jgi:PAS domain S-box-containing protein